MHDRGAGWFEGDGIGFRVTGALSQATIWARDGAFVDTLAILNGGIAYGLFERAGRYVVNVQAEQYAPWSRSGVQITEDECHVRTVELTARLQAES